MQPLALGRPKAPRLKRNVRRRFETSMLIQELSHAPRRRPAAVAAVLFTVTACGASPTAPGGGSSNTSPPPLSTGSYSLSVVAPDFTLSNGTLIPACPGAGSAGYGYIEANAIVQADGAASRVLPITMADGNFELRLLQGSAAPQRGVPVSGSIRGLVVNTRHSLQFGGAPVDARATFSGLTLATDAQVDGVIVGDSVLTSGNVSGNVAVGNLSGSAVNCASGTVSWSLSRLLR
jgi:hypothetical protein